MGNIDVVVGTFESEADAQEAAADLTGGLELEPERVATERIDVAGEEGERIVLVASVPIDVRTRVRDSIWRHHGRQVPLDWLSGRQDLVAPETFPLERPRSGSITTDVAR